MSKPLGPIRPSSVSNGARHHMTRALATARGEDGSRQRAAPSSRAASAGGVIALRPGEPVGALLELAGEQRRADEQPRERGEHGHDARGRDEPAELALEVRRR